MWLLSIITLCMLHLSLYWSTILHHTIKMLSTVVCTANTLSLYRIHYHLKVKAHVYMPIYQYIHCACLYVCMFTYAHMCVILLAVTFESMHTLHRIFTQCFLECGQGKEVAGFTPVWGFLNWNQTITGGIPVRYTCPLCMYIYTLTQPPHRQPWTLPNMQKFKVENFEELNHFHGTYLIM